MAKIEEKLASGLAARGMPRWREKQRLLPIAEKIRLVGQCVLETRELERMKAIWKQSATYSSASSKTGQ